MRTPLPASSLLARFVLVIPFAAAIAQTQVPAVQKNDSVNDVSRLNPISVRQVYQVRTEDDVRAVLARAAREHLKVSIAGKRHSQGGQTAHPDGLVLDMTGFNQILGLDKQTKIVTVQSGATWEQVQDYANPFGLAVEVQQASNIFTVGGSLSVNAHGRDPRFGPIIQTVRSFHLMTADGSVVQASRPSNPELFSSVIGGYGLFGVIVDVDLQLTEDDVYEKKQISMSYDEYPAYFLKHVRRNPEIGLEYAWPSIRKSDFLRHFAVYTFTKTAKRPENIFKLQQEKDVGLESAAFGISRHSEVGKDMRWFLQETIGDLASTRIISRNNAMRPPIKFLAYDSPSDTDIVQEYFVPIGHFVEFMDHLREICLSHNLNLLSATIRYVPKDDESFLAYARQDSFAVVLYINQSLTADGRRNAEEWTRLIVQAALANEGTYYLPYQQYPSLEQLRQAYPMLDAFISRKRKYDPTELFSSSFFEKYGAPRAIPHR